VESPTSIRGKAAFLFLVPHDWYGLGVRRQPETRFTRWSGRDRRGDLDLLDLIRSQADQLRRDRTISETRGIGLTVTKNPAYELAERLGFRSIVCSLKRQEIAVRNDRICAGIGASVIDCLKSPGISPIVLSAAAVIPSGVASAQLPARFCINPKGSLVLAA
jgi:hypothetical protein